MGVVRIDDNLLKEIKEFLNRAENKYKFGSLSAFVNFSIHEKLKETGKEDGGGKRKNGKR